MFSPPPPLLPLTIPPYLLTDHTCVPPPPHTHRHDLHPTPPLHLCFPGQTASCRGLSLRSTRYRTLSCFYVPPPLLPHIPPTRPCGPPPYQPHTPPPLTCPHAPPPHMPSPRTCLPPSTPLRLCGPSLLMPCLALTSRYRPLLAWRAWLPGTALHAKRAWWRSASSRAWL